VARVGSSYTASAYVNLVSLLASTDIQLAGKSVLMYSYGSGSASCMYMVRVSGEGDSLASLLAPLEGVFDALDRRTRHSPEQYRAKISAYSALYGKFGYRPIGTTSTREDDRECTSTVGVARKKGVYYLDEIQRVGKRLYAFCAKDETPVERRTEKGREDETAKPVLLESDSEDVRSLSTGVGWDKSIGVSTAMSWRSQDLSALSTSGEASSLESDSQDVRSVSTGVGWDKSIGVSTAMSRRSQDLSALSTSGEASSSLAVADRGGIVSSLSTGLAGVRMETRAMSVMEKRVFLLPRPSNVVFTLDVRGIPKVDASVFLARLEGALREVVPSHPHFASLYRAELSGENKKDMNFVVERSEKAWPALGKVRVPSENIGKVSENPFLERLACRRFELAEEGPMRFYLLCVNSSNGSSGDGSDATVVGLLSSPLTWPPTFAVLMRFLKNWVELLWKAKQNLRREGAVLLPGTSMILSQKMRPFVMVQRRVVCRDMSR